MESCEAVEKEIDKVIQKFTDIKGETIETINEVISVFSVLMSSLGKQRILNLYFLLIQNLNNFLISGNMNGNSTITQEQATELKNVIKRCKEKLQNIGSAHRNVHSQVTSELQICIRYTNF